MRKMSVAVLALIALATACSKSSSTTAPTAAPATSVAATASPSSVAPSPPPAPQKIGDCQIQKKTSCPGADLSGANLHSAQLASSNLKNADLSGADLRYANLRSADLKGADLSGAKMDYAKMDYSNLTNANLSRTALTGTHMTHAKAKSWTTTGAYFCKTTMPDGSVNSSGCSPSPGPKPSASPAKGGPKITSFTVPNKVDCLKHGSKSKQVSVSWSTKYATAATLYVGGKTYDSNAPLQSGETVTVKCNAPSVTITLKVMNDTGSKQASGTVLTGI